MELKWYNKQGKIYTDIQQNSMRYLFAEGITKLLVLYEKKRAMLWLFSLLCSMSDEWLQ